jgi:ATP-dependent helicase HrpA
LPAHLRPSFRVVDDGGEPVAEGADLSELKDRLKQQARSVTGPGHEVEQIGLTSWTIGELSREVEVGDPPVKAYPALVDEGGSVAVRLVATPREQSDAMWAGCRRLLALSLPSVGRILRLQIDDDAKRAIRSGPHGSAAEWVADCTTCVAGGVLSDGGGPAWNAEEFAALVDLAWEDLDDRADAVAGSSLRILTAAAKVRRSLASFEGPAADDIHGQLDQLVYPNFVAAVGADHLEDIERYLLAIERRIERVREDPVRDAELMAKVHRLEEEHDRLMDIVGPTPELANIAWMLQELRVSFFAQSLGTRGKVSEQRIAKALADATR